MKLLQHFCLDEGRLREEGRDYPLLRYGRQWKVWKMDRGKDEPPLFEGEKAFQVGPPFLPLSSCALILFLLGIGNYVRI